MILKLIMIITFQQALIYLSAFLVEGNEIGIGYAYLDGADEAEISNTHAVEAYAKFNLFSYEKLNSDLTLDFQYMKDNYKNSSEEKDREGFIVGFRWNLSF